MLADPEFSGLTRDCDMQNVLSARYASPQMNLIWSQEDKTILERRLWVAVLKAQRMLGLPIFDEDIEDYERTIDVVNLKSIDERERSLRHDVKAKIEEFNALAGHELIHLGMTSRDLTDNIEQVQIMRSLHLVRDRTVALIGRLARRSIEWEHFNVCGRTHNVPAQVTTLGKRFSMWLEELLLAFETLEQLIEMYPLRGIKGPVGTQQDMLVLLRDEKLVRELENIVCEHFDFDRPLISVGQVYPRSLDYQVVALLAQLASAPANFAKTLRLMAGQQQAGEGFKEGQTGSSAMPHKMNSRTCERIGGFLNILRGHVTMVGGLLGDQWYEGDVSCSIVRRVVLPDAFFAIDGMLEASMTVLDEMGLFEPMIGRELAAELPFLCTTRFLAAATERGEGREVAHRIIKTHATRAVAIVRDGGSSDCLAQSLGGDPDFPLSIEEIRDLIVPDHGNAVDQVRLVAQMAEVVLERYPDAVHYNPAPIL